MNTHIDRILDLDLPQSQSAFLWGPRKTGKSTYLKKRFPDSPVYDFLKTDLFLELLKAPHLLREQLLAVGGDLTRTPVILDEVQKVPRILDEVHWLIENKGLKFVLCGSSARKLKRGAANLLGGRAWRFEMLPLTWLELHEMDLLRALNHGLVPLHYLQEDATRSLKGYVRDYLKEEVFAEGLTRNLAAFSRFFDAVGYSQGELVNYANIARDCGVDAKTVKEYFTILEDTLLGFMVPPFKRRPNRGIITRTPKFYLFDVGVAGILTGRRIPETRGAEFGKAFEHFILMEIRAFNSYRELDFRTTFWRTKGGLEVDFVLGDGEVAVEVKGTGRVDGRELRSMQAFVEEYAPARALVVCNERARRVHRGIEIIPWKEFLGELWAGDVIG